MGNYKELRSLIQKAAGTGKELTFWTGKVVSVEDTTCTVDVGNLHLSGVRLRASLAEEENQFLLVPATGSAVLLGSLSGDYASLAVLKCDKIQRILVSGGQIEFTEQSLRITHKVSEGQIEFTEQSLRITHKKVEVSTDEFKVAQGNVLLADGKEPLLSFKNVVAKIDELIGIYNMHTHASFSSPPVPRLTKLRI